MEILELISSYFGLIIIWNVILTVIVIAFLICVPKYLKDIAEYLRGIRMFGISILPPDFDGDDDDVPDYSNAWYHNNKKNDN